MKTAQIIAALLFVYCFPLLLLSFNLRLEVSNTGLYEYSFDEYNAVEVTGIEEGELDEAAENLVDYFNGSIDSPQMVVSKNGHEMELFNQKEITHLKDVKNLIQMFYTIQWITIIYTLIFIIAGFLVLKKNFVDRLLRLLFFGGVATFALLAFFGIWAAISFDNLFNLFHETSFSNDLWKLDPRTDYLIMMFPEDFFFDAAVLLIGATLVEAFLIGGGAWFYHRKRSRNASGLTIDQI